MRQAHTAALLLSVFAGSAWAIPTQPASSTQPQQNQQQPVINQAGAINQPIKHNYVSRPGVLEFTGQMIVRPRQDLYAANNPNPNARASDITAPGARLLAARLAAPLDPARSRIAADIIEHYPEVDTYVVQLPAGMDENTYADTLMATGDYEYVEPNWLCFPTNTVPNDPQFNNSWQHSRLDSANAWSIETGSSDVIVAIVDTGIDLDHPDLVDALVPGYASFSSTAQLDGGDVNDNQGHGTFCAGVAAARGNNNNQVVGVGWNLSLMPIKAANSASGSTSSDRLDRGARWAAENGADMINVSYSGVASFSTQTTAEYAKQFGTLYFRSAGNDGIDISGFDHKDVVIVGASTINDNRAGFSNFGRAIDVFAPGQGVRGTRVGGSTGNSSGTSFASPIAAGVGAMIRSVNPQLNASGVQYLLYNTSDDLGASGEDNVFGFGRTNTFNAVTAAQQTIDVAPIVVEQPLARLESCPQPSNILRLEAESAFFGDTVQWLRDGQPIPGATDLTLNLGGFEPTISGTYIAQFTNSFGTTLSEPSAIDIYPETEFIQPLENITVFEGQDAEFTFEINNPLNSVVWLVDGNVATATSNTLSFNNLTLEDSGTMVRALVTGECGFIDTFNVTLTVLPQPQPCPADVNNDGMLNGLDFGAWLGAFNANAPEADQNSDGQINGLDFGAWLANFNAGCD